MMLPETMISAIYIAIAAVHGASATSFQDVLIAVMYLSVALIYLLAPHLRRD